MISKRLLERQAKALRYANSILRQSVPPEKQKFLPSPTEITPPPPTLKDRFIKILPKIAKVLAVFVVLGAIAALIAVEISILSSKVKEEPFKEDLPQTIPLTENVSGLNAYFGGCAAEYGDRVYFLSSVQDKLCYIDAQGQINKISKQPVSNIAIKDNYIYYINRNTNALEKVDVHSGAVSSVGMAVCTSAVIDQDGIYCIALENDTLRKYDLQGKTYQELFTEKIATLDVAAKAIYLLTQKGELYMLEEELSLIAENIHLSGLIDGALYFSDGESLFRITDGQSEDTGLRARDFNGNAKYLVLQNPTRKTELILHREDGSVILAADYAEELTVTENYVIYLSVDGYRYMIHPDGDLERTLLP